MKKPFNKLFYSLPNRLLAMFIIFSFIMTLLIVGGFTRGFSNQWEYNIRPHLLNYLGYINDEIGYPPNIQKAEALTKELPINIYIIGNGINYSSTGKPLNFRHLDFDRREREWRRPPHDDDKYDHHDDDDRRPIINRRPPGKISFGEYYDRTVLRNTIGPYKIYYELAHKKRRDQRIDIIQKAIFILLILFGTSYFILRRMIRPIQDIEKGVNRMRKGELTYQIPVRKENDLGNLTKNINSMSAEIDQMLSAKRQLLLAVSHELRSPLTRAKVALSMIEDEKYRDSVEQDLLEMEKLISEILEAERINGPHTSLNINEVSPQKILHDLSKDYENKIIIHETNTLPNAQWDETRIRLLLRNIINNAIHYSKDTPDLPSLTASYTNDSIVFTITDHGTGIPAADLDKVTEPFYRADSSRTRSTGGFGLGLYICKLITKAHNGQLTIHSKEPEGTKVTIELPIKPSAPDDDPK